MLNTRSDLAADVLDSGRWGQPHGYTGWERRVYARLLRYGSDRLLNRDEALEAFIAQMQPDHYALHVIDSDE